MRAASLLALLLAVVGATSPAAAEPPATGTPAATATLVVEVEGLKDDRGTLHAALYASEDGFPTKPEKALRQVDAPIAGGRARATFDGLAPGGYAVAAYHDENGDGKLDTGFLGIPTEGLGASNDAKGFMGPPSFEKARVEVKAGENRITVRITY
ncbi:MAG TPA: DUF2141 domain-containing protein [Anaeromyxobacteraceae bacterium]|nr:DUF2141 domain-containing protein [Anaeromyxobacteraceae bacterium]